MLKLLGVYKNGNYSVKILSDGTKIRETNDDEFIPSFAENCDVKITDKCDGGCPFCYEGCTPNGRHGDIMNYKFLDTLHPYTELAINGNDLSHPDLVPFMHNMKEKKIILNMTVNQIHFERHFDTIKEWIDNGLIYGLGVSLKEPTDDFINKIIQFPNAVIHVINGVVSVHDLARLAGHNLKVLILGYKNLRRGQSYYEQNDEIVNTLQEDLDKYLFPEIINNSWFKVVSFDNLAIKQLDIKSIMSPEEWDQFYMGDDGQFTMYIDTVNKEFAVSSTSKKRYPYTDETVEEMFAIIRKDNGYVVNSQT
jgi:hypothetical protein